MKVVILAGGMGSRLSEETSSKPKPLVEIGGMPILWHIMMTYYHHGLNDFIICCGHKGYMIKEYFAKSFLHLSDFKIDVKKNNINILSKKKQKNLEIKLVDTGEKTATGGRIKKIKKYINSTFCLTYGDGVAKIDNKKLINFHNRNKKLATMTVVNPPTRFGSVELKNKIITKFNEKPIVSNSWINGGFFVLEPEVINYIQNNSTMWEQEPLKKLSKKKKVVAFKLKDFWHPMDTLRDKNHLNDLWNSRKAPWKIKSYIK